MEKLVLMRVSSPYFLTLVSCYLVTIASLLTAWGTIAEQLPDRDNTKERAVRQRTDVRLGVGCLRAYVLGGIRPRFPNCGNLPNARLAARLSAVFLVDAIHAVIMTPGWEKSAKRNLKH